MQPLICKKTCKHNQVDQAQREKDWVLAGNKKTLNYSSIILENISDNRIITTIRQILSTRYNLRKTRDKPDKT